MVNSRQFYDNQNIIRGSFRKKRKPRYSFKPTVLHFVIILVVIGIAISAGSYSLVLFKEDSLQELHTETSKLKENNNEMKTKVEVSKSIYNIESKAETLNHLEKPKKLIEISDKNVVTSVRIEDEPKKDKVNIVSGY